jgi:hypothetical protein
MAPPMNPRKPPGASESPPGGFVRPRYERAADREAQYRLACVLADRYPGWMLVEMPPLAGWDYELRHPDAPPVLVEIKSRTTPRLQYPSYLIAESKLSTLAAAARRCHGKAVLLVGWSDAVGAVRIDCGASYAVSVGGRADRGDPYDREPCAHIPIGDFKVLMNYT